MSRAKVRFPGKLEELTTSEMKASIKEANLGTKDTDIAKMYLLERKAQIDVADCCGIDRKTLHKLSWDSSKKVHNTTKLPLECPPAEVFLCDNISMEDVGNKGCTRRSPPHGLLIFTIKDV